MFATIVIILFALAAVGCLAVGIPLARKQKQSNTYSGVGTVIAGAVCALIAFGVLIFSTVATVGPSDVGVETSFGHMSGDLSPGFHIKPPWVAVTNWDDSQQQITYGRDTNQSKGDHCLLVRIGGQQSACLALTFVYHVRPQASDALFRAYRGDQSRMADLLVQRTLDSDLNARLETFSPIQAMASGNQGAAALSPYARQVEADLQRLIGSDVVVAPHSLFIPYVSYDPATTTRLNKFQTQIADTLIATQAVKTAEQQALANQKLAASVSHDPNVITFYCAQTQREMISNGMNPAGVNCFAGGGSTVVVPGK